MQTIFLKNKEWISKINSLKLKCSLPVAYYR